MAHGDVAQFAHVATAELAERRADIVDVNVDQVRRSLFAQRAEAPQERFAGKRRVGTQRHGPRRIDPGSHATVVKQRGAVADPVGDRGQHVNRRRQRVDLAAAVIGDEQSVKAEFHRTLRIVGVHHALENQRPVPFVAVAGNFVPCERAAAFPANKCCGFGDADARFHIRRQ